MYTSAKKLVAHLLEMAVANTNEIRAYVERMARPIDDEEVRSWYVEATTKFIVNLDELVYKYADKGGEFVSTFKSPQVLEVSEIFKPLVFSILGDESPEFIFENYGIKFVPPTPDRQEKVDIITKRFSGQPIDRIRLSDIEEKLRAIRDDEDFVGRIAAALKEAPEQNAAGQPRGGHLLPPEVVSKLSPKDYEDYQYFKSAQWYVNEFRKVKEAVRARFSAINKSVLNYRDLNIIFKMTCTDAEDEDIPTLLKASDVRSQCVYKFNPRLFKTTKLHKNLMALVQYLNYAEQVTFLIGDLQSKSKEVESQAAEFERKGERVPTSLDIQRRTMTRRLNEYFKLAKDYHDVKSHWKRKIFDLNFYVMLLGRAAAHYHEIISSVYSKFALGSFEPVYSYTYSGSVYELYYAKSVGQAVFFSNRPTGNSAHPAGTWCVGDEGYAKTYLSSGPLFFITKNGYSYAAISLRANGVEINTIENRNALRDYDSNKFFVSELAEALAHIYVNRDKYAFKNLPNGGLDFDYLRSNAPNIWKAMQPYIKKMTGQKGEDLE